MQVFREDPPFQLGESFKGTDADSNLINVPWLGTRCAFEHVDYSISGLTAGRSRLTGTSILAIALRNTSGIALRPKRMVMLDVAAGLGNLRNATGYNVLLLNGISVLCDPWLPAAGVAANDIFWGIYKGPAIVLTPTVGADFNGADISAGGCLFNATGSTSGNSTGGRVTNLTLAGQTAATASFSAARNFVGYALSARTTGETAADLLVNWNVQI